MRRRLLMFRVLGLSSLVLALAAGLVLAGGDQFPYNASLFLSRKGAGSLTEANEYYATMGAPATLAAWKALYFPASGGQRASANYYNAGDLGFGREMHCYEAANLSITACYVANHGLGAGAPADLAVQDAVNNTRNLPTVAMVFDFATYQATPPNNANAVRFYVYGTDGNLLRQVALDSEGDKNVPQLCLACHGGTYDSGTNKVTGANFLPFDLDSFVYSPTPGQTQADQAAALDELNRMAYNTLPDAKIQSLIDGWYGGVGAVYNANSVYDDSYIPPAYDTNAADRQLYNEVVKPSCRSCHMAQTSTTLAVPADIDNQAYYPVFESYEMPHAQLTNHNFWSSAAPAILARRFVTSGETFVVKSLSDGAPGPCDANCTLREAIIAANVASGHNTIVFDVNGVFQLTHTGASEDAAATGDLDITDDLTLLGNGVGLTVIDGNATDRVFDILTGAQVVMQNLSIQNGSAPVGGGVHVTSGGTQLTLNFSMLQNNLATDGGGLAVEYGAVLEVNQSMLYNNSATSEGGGVYVYDAIAALYNTSLISNNADFGGGGVFTQGGSSTSLQHVTIALNNASSLGPGLLTFDGAATNIERSIVTGNFGTGNTQCAVLAGGSAANQFSNGYNLFGQNGTAGGCPDDGGSDQVVAGTWADILASAFYNDPVHGVPVMRPSLGSPAVDAIPLGAQCSAPSYDAHNVARPRDGSGRGAPRCDIGAAELVTWPVRLPLVVR